KEADELEAQLVERTSLTPERQLRLRVDLLRARARAFRGVGRADEASAALHAALEIDPTRRETRLALLYLQLDDPPARAARATAAALRADSRDDREVVTAAAIALYQDGQLEAAGKALAVIAPERLSRAGQAFARQLAFEVEVRTTRRLDEL